TGTGRDDFEAELAGEVIAQTGGAHFGDGESAGGDYQGGGMIFGRVAADDEFGGVEDFGDFGVQDESYVGGAAFGFEHVGDVARRIVAEELAECFFVVGDAVLID